MPYFDMTIRVHTDDATTPEHRAKIGENFGLAAQERFYKGEGLSPTEAGDDGPCVVRWDVDVDGVNVFKGN